MSKAPSNHPERLLPSLKPTSALHPRTKLRVTLPPAATPGDASRARPPSRRLPRSANEPAGGNAPPGSARKSIYKRGGRKSRARRIGNEPRTRFGVAARARPPFRIPGPRGLCRRAEDMCIRAYIRAPGDNRPRGGPRFCRADSDRPAAPGLSTCS